MIDKDYKIQACITEHDLLEYKSCFDNNNSPKSISRLKWMHMDNPPKKILVDFCVDKNTQEVGGIYAVFPVYLKIKGIKELCCQSVDTLVDKKHRKKGLFNSLATSVYERCKSNNVNLVYGFPNDQSNFTFFNRLDWKQIAEVPFKIRVFNTEYIKKKLNNTIFSKIIPKIKLKPSLVELSGSERIEQIFKFDDRTLNIWTKFSLNIGISIEQSSEYLNWRIFSKPLEKYNAYLYIVDDIPVAYCIYTVKDKHDGKIGYIMDFICIDENQGNQKLLRFCIQKMSEENVDVVLAWNFNHSPNSKYFKNVYFIGIPRFLQPIKLFFGARCFNKVNADFVNDKNNWYLSYLDSDTV